MPSKCPPHSSNSFNPEKSKYDSLLQRISDLPEKDEEDYVELDIKNIHWLTDKAVLTSFTSFSLPVRKQDEIWIPYSQLAKIDDQIYVTKWFYERNLNRRNEPKE